ncbi:class I lanthipeptide [Acidobacteriota bacterium]
MKQQKKFGRKLQLNKETIARLDQRKVKAGGLNTVCADTIETEALCDSICYCPPTYQTCTCDTCPPCPSVKYCPCQEPLTY